MLFFVKRIAAAVVGLSLALGGLGPCAGWQATPEMRMACCRDGSSCPMHQKSSRQTARVVTQAAADACCAMSGQDDSTPSASVFVPVVALGPVVSPVALVSAPARTSADGRRFLVPRPASHVPKHVLHSVFLI